MPIAHVWICIYELPPKYFYKLIINVIASAIGPVVFIDERMKNREMLHFARVLVELDLQKEKETFIMYERLGHCATVSIGYEQHPSFCSHCQRTGHSTFECSRHQSMPFHPKAAPSTKPTANPSPGTKDTNKEWVRVGKKPITTQMPSNSTAPEVIPSMNAMVPYIAPTIATHNAFSALHVPHEDIHKDLLAHAMLDRKRDLFHSEKDQAEFAADFSPSQLHHNKEDFEEPGDPNDGVTSSESEDVEHSPNKDVDNLNGEVESYPNDPLFEYEPPKYGRGRPKIK